jgi:aminoglycoside phosphotransferase family enzyme
MQDHYTQIAQGKLVGYAGVPTHIQTVISDVFLFEDAVLKRYKRDVGWWNTGMTDLSKGQSRIDFITNDFAFNQALNPDVYRSLQTLAMEGDQLILRDPQEGEDELIIVMRKVDTSKTFTKVLVAGSLQNADYESIGRQMANKKRALSRDFLPKDIHSTWYEQLVNRFNDLEAWVLSEESFPRDIAETGLRTLREVLEAHRHAFAAMTPDALSVCVDCNSENLLYADGTLSFLDAYPPKAAWKIGAFNHDIFRTGSDIYALAGKEAYESFLQGVYSVVQDALDPELHNFYLLYGAMIMGPYFYMLGKKNSVYLKPAEQYAAYIKEVLL